MKDNTSVLLGCSVITAAVLLCRFAANLMTSFRSNAKYYIVRVHMCTFLWRRISNMLLRTCNVIVYVCVCAAHAYIRIMLAKVFCITRTACQVTI